MEETQADENDLFFVYCDIFESISTHLSSSLGISLENIVYNIGIIEEIEKKMKIDVPKAISHLLEDISDIIEEIRKAYHISFKEKKIEKRELWGARESVRDHIGKIERRIGKIESLIEMRERKERIALRNEVKKLQGIKKTIKEFNDNLGGIDSIEWEAGLSKATVSITPKKGGKFYVAKTKLFDLAIVSPLDIVVSIKKRNVSIVTEGNGLLFDFFSIPFIKQIFVHSMSIDAEEGVKIDGLQGEKEVHVDAKREEKEIHIEFLKDNEKFFWTFPIY